MCQSNWIAWIFRILACSLGIEILSVKLTYRLNWMFLQFSLKKWNFNKKPNEFHNFVKRHLIGNIHVPLEKKIHHLANTKVSNISLAPSDIWHLNTFLFSSFMFMFCKHFHNIYGNMILIAELIFYVSLSFLSSFEVNRRFAGGKNQKGGNLILSASLPARKESNRRSS